MPAAAIAVSSRRRESASHATWCPAWDRETFCASVASSIDLPSRRLSSTEETTFAKRRQRLCAIAVARH
jgi:hypothetical protein